MLRNSSNRERRVRICEGDSSTDTKVSEGGEAVAAGARAEIPLQS